MVTIQEDIEEDATTAQGAIAAGIAATDREAIATVVGTATGVIDDADTTPAVTITTAGISMAVAGITVRMSARVRTMGFTSTTVLESPGERRRSARPCNASCSWCTRG